MALPDRLIIQNSKSHFDHSEKTEFETKNQNRFSRDSWLSNFLSLKSQLNGHLTKSEFSLFRIAHDH